MAKKLEKSVWRPYFEAVSKVLTGKRAEVEVAALQLGHQIQAEWMPLVGIIYDPKNDLIEVALEGVDHLINKPREVWVEAEGVDLSSIEIVDGEGARQIILLKEPLMLPAPQPAKKAG